MPHEAGLVRSEGFVWMEDGIDGHHRSFKITSGANDSKFCNAKKDMLLI